VVDLAEDALDVLAVPLALGGELGVGEQVAFSFQLGPELDESLSEPLTRVRVWEARHVLSSSCFTKFRLLS
jgi:hypothetical protein